MEQPGYVAPLATNPRRELHVKTAPQMYFRALVPSCKALWILITKATQPCPPCSSVSGASLCANAKRPANHNELGSQNFDLAGGIGNNATLSSLSSKKMCTFYAGSDRKTSQNPIGGKQ
jgi:hypothetical protein